METHPIILGLVHIKQQPQSTRTPLHGLTLLSPFIKELCLLTGFSLQDQYSQSEQNPVNGTGLGTGSSKSP